MTEDDNPQQYQVGATSAYYRRRRLNLAKEDSGKFNVEVIQMKHSQQKSGIGDKHTMNDIYKLEVLKKRKIIPSEQGQLEKQIQELNANIQESLKNFPTDHYLAKMYNAVSEQ